MPLARFARSLGTLLGLSLLAGPALGRMSTPSVKINNFQRPAVLEPYKKGMELAAGAGQCQRRHCRRKLQLIVRDDNANPGDAVRGPRSWWRARRSMC